MPSIVSFVKTLENFFFRFRVATLAVLLVFTLVMGWLAAQLHMTAGFDKQLPIGHEYIDTFFKYRTQLFGSNRIMVVVRAKKGDIWTRDSLKKLHEVTEAVLFLPGVDRRSVQSLWTPNTRVYELNVRGYHLRHDQQLSEVGLVLTLWAGVFEGKQTEWLRWCTLDGTLIPTGAERAEQERTRAERLAAQLRALGIEPEV